MAQSQKRRLVFMGTPAFAGRILTSLIDAGNFDIVGVYTRPDKKSGRGLKTAFSEVKEIALERGLPLYQPSSFRQEEAVEELRRLEPDYLAVAAYGLILPQKVLDIPSVAPINVHASLLPTLRGAAPIQRAIMENPHPGARTGVSIMKMLASLDTGPVYAQREVPIERKNYETLEAELAEAGAALLLETLTRIEKDGLEPMAQDDAKATYAPKLEKSDGRIDWTRTAAEVDALIRAVNPWPGAQCSLSLANGCQDLPVTLHQGHPGQKCQASPGQIMRHKKGFSIACGDCWYEVQSLRPQGRKLMSAADFANGQIKIRDGICGHAENIF